MTKDGNLITFTKHLRYENKGLMRIFQVLEAHATEGLSRSQIWLHNLYEPLVEMGHEVILFSAEEGQKAMSQHDAAACAVFSQRLLETFFREHTLSRIDLFFAYVMDGMVETGVIDEISKAGVPTCNFSCNNTHQFYLVDELSPHFDYNLHTEKGAADKFSSIGANPVWFPMAANPKYYHPYDVARNIEVSFVGRAYARRPYYIWHLLENGIDVQVYGPRWLLKSDKALLRRPVHWARRAKLLFNALIAPSVEKRHEFSMRVSDTDMSTRVRSKYAKHLHHPISDAQMIRKYSESKISLGFLEVYDGHNPAGQVKQHLHLREFEAPMCGGLYFTGYCDELAEFYEPDKEVIIYRSEHELLDKVNFYLRHPNEAEKVREAGHKRSLQCHTYQKRLHDMLDELEFSQ